MLLHQAPHMLSPQSVDFRLGKILVSCQILQETGAAAQEQLPVALWRQSADKLRRIAGNLGSWSAVRIAITSRLSALGFIRLPPWGQR